MFAKDSNLKLAEFTFSL